MIKQYPYPADEYLLIGKVVKAHGLKGEIKTKLFNDLPDIDFNYSRLALVAEDGRMTALLEIITHRFQGRFVILKLDTIDTKAEADLLAEMGVLVSRDDLPELNEDQFYLEDLKGRVVFLAHSGTMLGSVSGFFNNGAQEIMIVHQEDNEYLVPLVDEIIIEISEQAITIDPPPGLLEINLK